MRTEPAAIIGFLSAVIVLVCSQAIQQGIVSSAGTVNVLNLVISLVPLVAGLVIRNFVTPTGGGDG
jgi:hypothetical protein